MWDTALKNIYLHVIYTRGQELATRDTDGYSVRNRTRVSISVGPYRPISDPLSLIFIYLELYFYAESLWLKNVN